MTNRQLELEELRRMCKKKYCGAPTGFCTFCGKVIRLDMFRHVANYHLELDAKCHGVPNGRVHNRTVLIISGWFIRCQLR